jgi:two-component system, NtrC family, sensor kinase
LPYDENIMVDGYLVYPLYLFYGMAFFAMGVSITSRDTRASNLEIARCLWLFSLFAYTHALLEWFSLYLILYSGHFSSSLLLPINSFKLFLLLISFCFLLLFGISILGMVLPQYRRHLFLAFPLLLIVVIVTSGVDNMSPHGSNFSLIDLHIRNWIGFPGGLIAGFGLILYSHTVRHISRRGALSFVGAGISVACYGVLAGLIASGSSPPIVGGPIELYRGLSALIIMFFVMDALYTFDIERKLQIEERLQRFAQSEKLHSLGKLAFGVAHEINNPLGNVSINAELLRDDLQNDVNFPHYEKRLSAIERNVERASKIAKELLFFSTNKETDFQQTDINELLTSTLELLGSRRKSYAISTSFIASETIPAIPWKLEEVFLNVIINAMDSMPSGGEIGISTGHSHEKLLVKIKDNGPGIKSQDLPHVLDPFFTTKEVGKGTGLGLSICFGIMEMHGGSIELSSTPDKGTEVLLAFPIGVECDV